MNHQTVQDQPQVQNMDSYSDTALRAVAARVGAPGGLAHVNELVPLLEATLSRSVSLPRRLAIIETLQAVFTQLWHDGHMSTSKASSTPAAQAAAGSKRKRPDEDADAASLAVAKWLRGVYGQFLDCLWWLLATPESELARGEAKLREKKAAKESGKGKKGKRSLADDEGEGAGEQSPEQAAISLRVAALAGLTHFFAHACTREKQLKEGGQHLCFEQLTAFLRRLLSIDYLNLPSNSAIAAAAAAAGADGGGSPKASGAWDPSALSPSQRKALSSPLSAFLSGYVSEWDDLQYFALRAVALLCEQTAQQAAGSKAAPASLATFSRNAIELLLAVSLPATHGDWAGGEHGAWVRAQWDEEIPAVYAALDKRIADAKRAAAAAIAGAAAGAKGGAGAKKQEEEEVTISDAAMRGLGGLLGGDDSDGEGGDDDDEEEDGPAAKATAAAAAAERKRASQPPHKLVAAATPSYWLLAEQRRVYAEAWVALLKLPGLPADVTRKALLALPTSVLPHMPERTPLLLSEFLTGAVDAGTGARAGSAGDISGITTAAAPSDASSSSASIGVSAGVDAVLALQSLFALMQSHALEYPRFYAAVYALATPATVGAKHRGRFFRQLDLYLASSALPAYLVAAFMKRLARLALASPPPVALAVLPILYNCVKRHPAVTPLVHRAQAQAKTTPGAQTQWPAAADPYNASTSDYAACRALESSLWEVMALSNHYYAPVAHAARGLMKRPEKVEVDVSGARVSGSTYASLVADEGRRRVKRQGKEQAVEVPFEFAPLGPGSGGEAGAGDVFAAGTATGGGALDFSA